MVEKKSPYVWLIGIDRDRANLDFFFNNEILCKLKYSLAVLKKGIFVNFQSA